jgi:multidrug efflux pump subunit AcrB
VLCGVFGLWILSRDLDVMARLSLVILVGIGVNNAIILIDLIQELRARGLSSSEAVIRACSLRLKPILMTTAIQVLGVIPVAVGNSKIMGIPYASLGVTIISGMLLSTAFTLAVIPWFYDLISSLESRLRDQLKHEAEPGKNRRSVAVSGDLIR